MSEEAQVRPVPLARVTTRIEVDVDAPDAAARAAGLLTDGRTESTVTVRVGAGGPLEHERVAHFLAEAAAARSLHLEVTGPDPWVVDAWHQHLVDRVAYHTQAIT